MRDKSRSTATTLGFALMHNTLQVFFLPTRFFFTHVLLAVLLGSALRWLRRPAVMKTKYYALESWLVDVPIMLASFTEALACDSLLVRYGGHVWFDLVVPVMFTVYLAVLLFTGDGDSDGGGGSGGGGGARSGKGKGREFGSGSGRSKGSVRGSGRSSDRGKGGKGGSDSRDGNDTARVDGGPRHLLGGGSVGGGDGKGTASLVRRGAQARKKAARARWRIVSQSVSVVGRLKRAVAEGIDLAMPPAPGGLQLLRQVSSGAFCPKAD